MRDKALAIVGLIIFLGAVTFPVWYTYAAGGAGPRPKPIAPEGECVEDRAFMTANHMKLLFDWRDAVVRDGKNTYTSKAHGKTHQMSLTRTCMDCHADRETFCNRCHDYADVHPNCWKCHVDPKGK